MVRDLRTTLFNLPKIDLHRHLEGSLRLSTLAEIALGLGLSSKGSTHKQVQALAEAGAIRLIPGRKRGIELTEDTDRHSMTIPLLGRIAAGQPIEAIPDQENLNVAEFLLGPDRFALLVQGDSMIDVGILDGDIIDKAVRITLDKSSTIDEVEQRIRAECELDEAVQHLLSFIATSDRGVARG